MRGNVWSRILLAAGVIGVGVSVMALRRPVDPATAALAYSGLALIVAGAAILHHVHPPPLTDAAPAPLLALVGAGLALTGGATKAWAAVRARRPPP